MPSFKASIDEFRNSESGPTQLTAPRLADGTTDDRAPPSLHDMLAVGLSTSEIAAMLGTSTSELEELIKADPTLSRKWDEARAYRRYEIQLATHDIALAPLVDAKAAIQALKMLREDLANEPFLPFGAEGKAQVNSITSVVAVASEQIKKKFAEARARKREEEAQNGSDSDRG